MKKKKEVEVTRAMANAGERALFRCNICGDIPAADWVAVDVYRAMHAAKLRAKRRKAKAGQKK